MDIASTPGDERLQGRDGTTYGPFPRPDLGPDELAQVCLPRYMMTTQSMACRKLAHFKNNEGKTHALRLGSV